MADYNTQMAMSLDVPDVEFKWLQEQCDVLGAIYDEEAALDDERLDPVLLQTFVELDCGEAGGIDEDAQCIDARLPLRIEVVPVRAR